MILPIYVTGHVNKCWKLLCLNLGPSLLKIKLFDPFRETVPLIGELFRDTVPLIGELFRETVPLIGELFRDTVPLTGELFRDTVPLKV